MVTGKSELVRLEAVVHAETTKAFKIDVNDDGGVWVPKSQVEVEIKTKNTIIVEMPEWMAYEKGLI